MKFLHAPNIKRGLDPPTKVLGPRLEVIVGDDGAGEEAAGLEPAAVRDAMLFQRTARALGSAEWIQSLPSLSGATEASARSSLYDATQVGVSLYRSGVSPCTKGYNPGFIGSNAVAAGLRTGGWVEPDVPPAPRGSRAAAAERRGRAAAAAAAESKWPGTQSIRRTLERTLLGPGGPSAFLEERWRDRMAIVEQEFAKAPADRVPRRVAEALRGVSGFGGDEFNLKELIGDFKEVRGLLGRAAEIELELLDSHATGGAPRAGAAAGEPGGAPAEAEAGAAAAAAAAGQPPLCSRPLVLAGPGARRFLRRSFGAEPAGRAEAAAFYEQKCVALWRRRPARFRALTPDDVQWAACEAEKLCRAVLGATGRAPRWRRGLQSAGERAAAADKQEAPWAKK